MTSHPPYCDLRGRHRLLKQLKDTAVTDDTYHVLCELEFIDTQSGDTVTARLGVPTFDPAQDWFCLSEILGVEEGRVQRLYGVDPFQAISQSFRRFRVVLTKLPGDFRTPTGDAAHTVFPQEIPWTHGFDVYRRLCKMVDHEIEKIEGKRRKKRNRKKD